MTDVLKRVQDWYASQCDGDWEHRDGVEIGTLDNPGWTGSIDVTKAILPVGSNQIMRLERSEHDWVYASVDVQQHECSSNTQKFEFDCGPHNLTEALEIFLQWTERVEWEADEDL